MFSFRRKVTGEKDTVDKEGEDNGTGGERSSCDRRKGEGKKEVRADVSKRKSIKGMMTGKKRSERKEQQRRWQEESQ